MEDGVMDSYGKMLDDLTAGLPEVLAEKVAKKDEFGRFSIKLSKVEAHLKEDFIPLGFNQFMFVPVTKHAESLASKYNWDSGSVWAIKEVEGDKLLVRDEEQGVILAKRALRTVESEEKQEKEDEEKEAQLSGDVWEIPEKVIEDVEEELKTREHPLSTSEEQDLGKLEKEKRERLEGALE